MSRLQLKAFFGQLYNPGEMLSIMLENIHLYTRLFVLVCAAVMSFIMCSDTARASQIKGQADSGVEHRVFRRLYVPNNQQHQLFSGPPSPETGLQSGISSKTETWNQRHISSIIDRQSKPVLFTGSSRGYRPNSPDYNSVPAAVSVQIRRQPHDDISTYNNNLPSLERLQPRENNLPTSRRIHNSNSAIIRKSSYSAAAAPSQVWSPNFVQTSHHQEQETLPVNDFSNKEGDKTAWQQYDLSPFSSQTHRYSSTSPPTQRWFYSNNRETNEPTEPGRFVTSRVIQARKYLSSASQTAPQAPSNRNRLDAFVMENEVEPQRSSIMDFSQGWQSERSGETPRRKNVQSYLFKDSQMSLNTGAVGGQGTFPTTTYVQKPSDNGFSSDFQQNVPTKHLPENINVQYGNANVAQTDAYTQSYPTTAETTAQRFVHSPQDTRESFVPTFDADFQDNSATLRGKPVLSGVINPSASGSMQPQKPAQINKSIYGSSGFQNPDRRTLKKPPASSFGGSNDSTNSQRYTFEKGRFATANVYPSLSQKYSFGRRGLNTNPVKSERRQTIYFTPSPSISDTTTTQSNPRPLTPGFMQLRPQTPESDAGLDSKSDNGKLKISRRVYGLKGFSHQPPEGTKASPSQPEKSTRVQQGFEGFKLRSSQTWQPESSHMQRYEINKTSQGSDPKLPSKTSRYKNYRRIYNFRGFQPTRSRIVKPTNKTARKNNGHPPGQEMPAFLRSSGPLKVLPHPRPDPRVLNQTKPVTMKASQQNSFTSSTVRGKRVKVRQENTKNITKLTPGSKFVSIVRLPKQTKKAFKGLTYSDILGSASFSSVRARTQTPADKFNTPNITATTRRKEEAHLTLSEDVVFERENSSRSSEEKAEDKVEDFVQVEEKKMNPKNKDTDLKTPDSLQDVEGSGSGDFSLFDGFSVKTNRLSDDLLETDYLRISAGNISFKSMNVSRNER